GHVVVDAVANAELAIDGVAIARIGLVDHPLHSSVLCGVVRDAVRGIRSDLRGMRLPPGSVLGHLFRRFRLIGNGLGELVEWVTGRHLFFPFFTMRCALASYASSSVIARRPVRVRR